MTTEITLTRRILTDQFTMGDLYLGEEFICFTEEDCDRGINQSMPIEDLKKMKIDKVTAIPAGKYRILVTLSDRFKRLTPQLMDVPVFKGIRIHPGNTDADTEGCLLPGTARQLGRVVNSALAYNALFPRIKEWVRQGELYITIRRALECEQPTFQPLSSLGPR